MASASDESADLARPPCPPPSYSSAGLSTKAGAKMTGELHFTYFVDYYGSNNYAHRWVEAAFVGSAIGFDNSDANFSLCGILRRLQSIKCYGTVLTAHLFQLPIPKLRIELLLAELTCYLRGLPREQRPSPGLMWRVGTP